MTRTASPLFLIGPRGSGKTTVGRRLAKRLHVDFLDTDARIVETAGVDVASIVAAKGWEGFRDLESVALDEACLLALEANGLVIATGGGMVLREANRERMRDAGLVIYLKGDVATLAGRLRRSPLSGQRPALTDKSLEDEIAQVLAEREPLYQACAHAVLDAALELPLLLERAQGVYEQWRAALS